MNAEYANETYWFLRDKKGDNISKKLFTEKKFQLPMTVIALKEAMFAYLKWSLLRNSISRKRADNLSNKKSFKYTEDK